MSVLPIWNNPHTQPQRGINFIAKGYKYNKQYSCDTNNKQKMSFKYFCKAFISIPLLPVMYVQGKMIRSKVPELPEAKGPEGWTNRDSKQKLKLLTIGESTIAGVGVENHEEGFTGILADELAQKLEIDIDWKVYARSGYTAKRVLEEIVPTITEQTADLLVIGLGGNDAFDLNTPWAWRRDVNKLITRLKEQFPKTPIVFINMPPMHEFPAFTSVIKFTIGGLTDILGETLAKAIVHQEDTHYYAKRITAKDWIERLDVEPQHAIFFSDGVHPSKLAYQVWAKDVSDYIANNQAVWTHLNERIEAI